MTLITTTTTTTEQASQPAAIAPTQPEECDTSPGPKQNRSCTTSSPSTSLSSASTSPCSASNTPTCFIYKALLNQPCTGSSSKWSSPSSTGSSRCSSDGRAGAVLEVRPLARTARVGISTSSVIRAVGQEEEEEEVQAGGRPRLEDQDLPPKCSGRSGPGRAGGVLGLLGTD